MYTCDCCERLACVQAQSAELPANCPIREEKLLEQAMPAYQDASNREFYIKASELEAIGYGKWPRLKETAELCSLMGFQKIGLAFCMGLRAEARIVASILREKGFEVDAVICKTGRQSKESVGISPSGKLCPEKFEAMCNPILQAKLLNERKTEFNIVFGLCVGHDSMFYKYSDALVTTLVVKDRVLAHNPIGAVYCSKSYYKNKL